MALAARLIVMLAAEVVGYIRLIQADEKGTLDRLAAHRDQLIYPNIAERCGRIVKATGDSLFVEFESPIEAVQCAVDLQRGMINRNSGIPSDQRIIFRLGLNIAKVMANGDDLVSRAVAALPNDTLATLIKPGSGIYGTGSHIAARLAALADAGGICISDTVRNAIRDQLPYIFEDIGKQNIDMHAAPVHCYAMSPASVAKLRRAAETPGSRAMRLRTAVVAVSVMAVVGVWGAALWAWLGPNSTTAPIPALVTAGSQISPVGGSTAAGADVASSARRSQIATSTAADSEMKAPPVWQSPVVNGTVAERETQTLSTPQSALAGTAAADRGTEAPSSRPASFEIGAAVVRGNQAASTLQTTTDGSAAIVRGRQEASALQIMPDTGTAVVRGTQAPSTLQIAGGASTDVVRGTRPPPSVVATPVEHSSTQPDKR